jgi:hypothetical protein
VTEEEGGVRELERLARLGDALAVFTAETSLAAEHARLMRGRRKEVRWEASTAPELPDDLRRTIGALWRERTTAEHRSIGIFSLFTLDLLGVGAPAEVLSHACRAALDEVRHAELFAKLARLYTGEDVTPPPGIPPLPEDPDVPLREQVAREALYLSAFAETYSAVLLSELHARAKDPVVKDVLGIVVADEIHHARLGWSILATMVASGGDEAAATLARDVVPTMDGLSRAMFGDPRALPAPAVQGDDRALAAAHGYISAREEHALFCAAMTEVWIPGLARLGVDAAALAGRYDA